MPFCYVSSSGRGVTEGSSFTGAPADAKRSNATEISCRRGESGLDRETQQLQAQHVQCDQLEQKGR